MNNSSKDEAQDKEASENRSAAIEQLFAAGATAGSFAGLRHALAFVAALHFTSDEKSAARTALEHFANAVKADTWRLYATRTQTALLANDGVISDPVVAFELLASLDPHKTDKPGSGTTKAKSATKAKTKVLSPQPSAAARAACEQGGAVSVVQKNQTILSIALRRDERIIGVLEVCRRQSKTGTPPKRGAKKASTHKSFTEREAQLLEALCQPLGAALSNAARIAEAELLSQIDDLTKLYNARFLRRYLTGEIKRAQRYKSTVAAFFFDIDDFKLVNDVHGHLVGSHMLLEMAAIVLSGVRETDMVARYGGDEFVVVLPETNAELAAYVADRVRRRIHAHSFTGGRRLKLKVTASFGVAAYPQHAQSPQQLVNRADHAMYAAKAAGKNCVLIDHADHADHATTARANPAALGDRNSQGKDSGRTSRKTVGSGAARANSKRQTLKS